MTLMEKMRAEHDLVHGSKQPCVARCSLSALLDLCEKQHEALEMVDSVGYDYRDAPAAVANVLALYNAEIEP